MKNLSRFARAVSGLAVALSTFALTPKAAAQPSGYAHESGPASNNYVSVDLTAPSASNSSNYTLSTWARHRTGGTAFASGAFATEIIGDGSQPDSRADQHHQRRHQLDAAIRLALAGSVSLRAVVVEQLRNGESNHLS